MRNPLKKRGPFYYHIDRIKYFDVEGQKAIEVIGWCYHTDIDKIDLELYVNNKKIEMDCIRYNRKDLSHYLKEAKASQDTGFKIFASLKDKKVEDLRVIAKMANEMKEIVHAKKKDLQKNKVTTPFDYSFDVIFYDKQSHCYDILGWAYSITDQPLTYKVVDQDGNVVDAKISNQRRSDLVEQHFVNEDQIDCGFHIAFDVENKKEYSIILSDGTYTESISLKDQKATRDSLIWKGKDNAHRVINYYHVHGLKKTVKKIIRKISNSKYSYDDWVHEHPITKEELERERNTHFAYSPKISVIVATFNTPLNFLQEMIDAVVEQTYDNWELCIGDGSTSEEVEKFVKEHYSDDERIRFKKLEENYGISGNMNAALDMVTGEYVSLYDHDDLITPNALFEVVKVLNENPDLEFIYTDEDKINSEGTKYFEPNFKPDFNRYFLNSNNYICHFLTVKKSLIDKVGNFDSKYDGAQDFDFVLRCTEAIDPSKIYHIPMALYHWRFHQNSTAMNPQSKMYAFDAGKRAVQDYYNRNNIHATVEHGASLGMYRSKFALDSHPLVSIIIPNMDHIDDLQRCIDSVEKKTNYRNFEIIVVENNSKEKETFAYYQDVEKQYNNVRVVYWKSGFNFSALNNYGATFAKGEYLLLLNNDTEVINAEWLEEMLGVCMQDDVGIVGCKLLYPDDTIQHAGVVIGMGGVAGHTFVGYDADEYGYFCYIQAQRNYSAVTAACMLVKRSVFDQVNGLTEELEVAFNDVDFCLKVVSAGFYVVYTPYAVLHHYESKSRGFDNTKEKSKRFDSEVLYFLNKWGEYIKKGDPYFNKNLSLTHNDFILKTNEHELDGFKEYYNF